MNDGSLKLIYFKGCPNAKLVEDRLLAAGFTFESVCQDTLPPNHPFKQFASPTLLQGELVVFGAATGVDGGCTLELPDVAELKNRLRIKPQ